MKIPAGTTDGSRIRLACQGGEGPGGGPCGDLYLHATIEPHDVFRINGHDLEVDLKVTPWEAALGSKVTVPTLDGNASITIPPGTQSGKKIRLRGKGLRGADLYAIVRIMVPDCVTHREKQLFEELARNSKFNPRE